MPKQVNGWKGVLKWDIKDFKTINQITTNKAISSRFGKIIHVHAFDGASQFQHEKYHRYTSGFLCCVQIIWKKCV